jgi:hypothetical protein
MGRIYAGGAESDAAPAAFSTKAGWKASEALNGTPAAAESGPTPGIVIINEVMSNPTVANGDWIELKNTTASPVNVGGWWLSNDPLNLKKYQIPAGTTIAANGYGVFTQAQFGFDISNLGSDVILSNNGVGGNLGGYREHVDFGAAASAVTFGVYTKTTGGTDFVAMSAPTQGAANSLPLFGPIVMSEIMYNPLPPGDEFIELQNLTGATFSLYDAANGNGWKFNEGVDYTFGPGASIPASGYALVVGIDPATFRSKYGVVASVPIYGPWTGALDDGGENVKLSKPGTPQGVAPNVIVPYIIEDQVHYNDHAPWPTLPDGLGPSLTRTPASAYGNDATNWAAGPNGGTPGGQLLPPANPYALTATTTGPNNVTLNWNDYSTTENGFRIERSTDGLTFTEIATTGVNATTYSDATGLTQGTRYYYRVRAYNTAGNSAYSNKASALTQTTSVLLIGKANPNPTIAGDIYADTWKYSVNNTNLGTAWRATGYTEPSTDGWLGPAPAMFWAKNGTPPTYPAPRNTAIPLVTAPATNDTPTYYFRKHFNLAVDPSTIASLTISSVLDDGMVVYFNGTQVFSFGMPTNVPAGFSHTTYTATCSGAGCVAGRTVGDAAVESFALPASAFSTLIKGDNVIAVEVHQAATGSSDIDFAMTLTATLNAPLPVITPDVVDVTPDPRPSGIDTATINFSEAVTGLDISDLTLARNGGANLLTNAQTVSSSNGGLSWTLTGLKSLTWVAGTYTLALLSGNSGIVGTAANAPPIGPDALDTFTVTTSSIAGTTASDNFYVRVNGSNFEVFTVIPPSGTPTYTVPVNEISSLTISGDTGNDVVEIGTPLPFDPVFIGGGGTDRLQVDVGTRTQATDLLAGGVEDFTIGGNAVVTLGAAQHISTLTLNNTARLSTAGQLLELNLLSMAAGAFLDLGDGDMIIHANSTLVRSSQLNLITGKIRASRESSPRWSAAGISSSLAAGNPVVGIAAIPNNVGAGGTAKYTTFDGSAVDTNAVLVKTTYNGDHDLDGDVDPDDFAAIDAGFINRLTGYFNGDFDYSGGAPDADDYFMIDRAYGGQGAPLGAEEVAPVTELSGTAGPTDSSGAVTTAATPATPQAPAAETITASASTSKPAANTFSSGPVVKAQTLAAPLVLESQSTTKTKKKTRHAFEF